MDTPRTYIIALLYISDDSTIATHVNREFGTKVTKQRVAQIRASIPQKAAPGPQSWVAKEPYKGDKYKRQEDAIRAASARLANSIRAAHG